MTPPTSRKKICGRIASARTRPKNSSRKLRCLSGAKTLPSRFTPLAPVALEPEVALGVRGRLVVLLYLVGVGCEAVSPGGCDERRLVHPVGDAVRPAFQRRPKPCEMPGDVLEHAEMGQREPGGLAALGLDDRRFP